MDKKEYYAIKFTNLKSGKPYGIKIERTHAVKCPFIFHMISSQMKEAKQLEMEKCVTVGFETTIEAIKGYFSWLVNSSQPSNNLDSLSLAIYFDDIQYQEEFVYPSLADVCRLYQDFNVLPETVINHYVNIYLNTCFDAKGNFGKRMMRFLMIQPKFAQWIWETCPREELLRAIRTPNKKFGRLSKMDFNDIYHYIAQTERIDDEYPDYTQMVLNYIDYVESTSEIADIYYAKLNDYYKEQHDQESRMAQKKAKKPTLNVTLMKGIYG